MCGITGSWSGLECIRLLKSVAPRGTRAFSLSLLHLPTYTLLDNKTVNKAFDEDMAENAVLELNEFTLKGNPEDYYYVGHLQSPTASNFSFHPAKIKLNNKKHYLWHNGQIDSAVHNKNYRSGPGELIWDTQILLEKVFLGFDKLAEFPGSFACVYLKEGEGLYAFRNAISPLYINNTSLCSVAFPDSTKVEKNTILSITPDKVIVVGEFQNDYNPFGVV